MGRVLKVEFVSDVACPWCAVGLASFERAMERVQGDIDVQLHFEPFELNPDMPPEGQDVTEHLTQKYGSTAEQQAAGRDRIRERGAEVGFEFRRQGRGRVHNTFNAHRLLAWAGEQDAGKQHALKRALLEAYHGQGLSPADPDVLAAAAVRAGLDEARAREILAGDEYTAQVRARERFWQANGIQAVPSVILDGKYLVQGGQPPEAFEQALRQAAAEVAET